LRNQEREGDEYPEHLGDPHVTVADRRELDAEGALAGRFWPETSG
jgi:hypothetical protein